MNNFRRYLGAFRRWFALLLLGPLVAGLAGYFVSSRQTPVYASGVRIIVGQTLQNVNPDYGTLAASERLVSTYAQLAQSRSVINAVNSKLARPDLWSSVRITTKPLPETEFLDINVQASDQQYAADVANGIASELILRSPAGPQSSEVQILEEVKAQITILNAEITATDVEISDLKQQIEKLGVDSEAAKPLIAKLQLNQQLQSQNRQTLSSLYNTVLGSRANSISVVEPAVPAATPIAPRPIRSGILAGLVALVLCATVIALLEFFDDTVKSAEEVIELAQAPLLAAIVKQPKVISYPARLIACNEPRSLGAESFRTLRTNLQFSTIDAKNRSLVVTSAQPEEGKSTVSANLAWVLAQTGQRVVLVDADLRKPTLHKIYGVDNQYGLTTMLTNTDDVTIAQNAMLPIDNHLTLIPSGPLPPNPSELLSSKRMEMLIWLLQQDYDWVIFDTPPLLTVTDSAALLPRVEGVVLVTESKRTRRDMIKKARVAIDTVGGKLLGVTANKLDPRTDGYGTYYYNYRYEAHPEAKQSWWKRKTKHRSNKEASMNGSTNGTLNGHSHANGHDPLNDELIPLAVATKDDAED